MCKKSKMRCGGLIYLISFVLVPVLAGNASADLVGHWEFDEGSGNVAYDTSGNGHDGILNGNPQWVDGQRRGALEFDGDGDYVEIEQIVSIDFTLMAWLKTDTPGLSSLGSPAWNGSGLIWSDVPGGGVNDFIVAVVDTQLAFFCGNPDALLSSDTAVVTGEWVHISAVRDTSTQTISTYINGQFENSIEFTNSGPLDDLPTIAFGGNVGDSRWYTGLIDDVRIYDHALLPDEILAAMLGKPELAKDPSPDDKEIDVPRDVILGWTPGEFAALTNGHKVYFGESFDDVNDGIGAITQSATSYTRPQRLDLGTTYYWRVDEVNAPPTSHIEFKGNVWSFTTEPIAYPIDGNNITATASSIHQADTGPENSINGSGLNANDLHSMEPTDMWLSSDEPNGAWIEYELDKVHKLHEMWVWNSNGMMEPILGFGLKDVTIEYSTNGSDYTTLGTTHEFVRAPGAADYAHNSTIDFSGATAKYVRLTANSNWGGILKQYGLSEVRFFSIPVFAREPSPDSGTTDVAVDVTLGFRAGREAAEHNVYISTDEQAVIDGTAPVTTVTENSYSTSLDVDSTYYWKINEVNEAETTTTWQGELWNFTTPEFFVVDGFEDYNDYPPNEIWATWVDGYGVPTNGATAGYPAPDFLAGEHYVETTIVHGGEQAMPFFYSNTGAATYSEGERTFAVPQDWSKAGIQTLVLYFHGTSGNTGQLYVKVNGFKVVYDVDAIDITRPRWHQWNIDLASFGVNLQSVAALGIGIDDSGASGTLYFDDIRLYRVAPPIPEPTDPGSTGLVAYYALDNNVEDGSGNGNHGTLQGTPQWVEGLIGRALQFNGSTDYVEVADAPGLDITNTITIAVWVKANTFGDWRGFVVKGLETAPYAMQMWGDGSLRFGWNWDSPAGAVGDGLRNSNAKIPLGEWAHLAVTYDGSTLRFYINGGLDTREVDVSLVFGTNNEPLILGCDFPGGDEYFDGAMDDVRIYNRALLPGEVMFLGDLIP